MRKTILMLAGVVMAVGAASGEARAVFIVQVTAVLNAPTPGTTTFGQSSVSLNSFQGSPANADLGTALSPVHETYGTTVITSNNTTGSDSVSLNYRWTLTFAHLVNGVATGQQASLVVTGTLAGLLSSTGSTLSNTYTGGPFAAPAMLAIDGQTIMVTLDSYTPPGTPPDSKNNFSVGIVGPANLTPVPEPTALALAGVGGLLMLAPYLRRRTRVVV